ncbi:type I phosphomannose isomerase catalytic subunit [Brevibacillus sp. TJ4]|uniref:type I phosphomannose isomerase catalytic subunit n=1 Tax=Brevibacillus sp. TJ4 TaxID=3234853 RepID=UPI003BA3CEB7
MPFYPTACEANKLDTKSFADCYPVTFKPIVQERVWGGSRLKSWYSLDDVRPIGEYWLLSAHPSGVSVVDSGPFAGMRLDELTARYPEDYLGRSPQERFPLLVKLIEAADDLSVQVHPDDSYALQAENDYGKTEAWYILDHASPGEIIYGHRFADADHFRRSLQRKNVLEYLNRRPIGRDELVYVPAGTLHAIRKGTILLEIQQTSDVTYRVYDWDRVDAKGSSRQLHIDQAAAVMFRTDQSEQTIWQRKTLASRNDGVHERLLSSPFFTIERLSIPDHRHYVLHSGRPGNPDVLIVLEGEGWLEYGQPQQHISYKKGDLLLIPASIPSYRVHADRRAKIIRTYY